MKSYYLVRASLALLAVFVTGAFATNGADRPGDVYERVVNGNNADQHEWPWQISLRVRGRHICGGSLIRTNMVLTAAHCVIRNKNPTRYKVVVGAHHRLQSTAAQETFGVHKIYEHKEFAMHHLKKDVALLVLDRPVTLSQHVKLIELPKQGDRVPVGTECYITGWGRTVGGGSVALILQEAPLRIAEHQKCASNNKFLEVHEKSMLCAGGEGKGGCQGDSGGPLSCQERGKWILRGVVSWGHARCDTGYYTVFARVSSFIKWINNPGGVGGGSSGRVGGGSSGCLDKDPRCSSWNRYCSYHPYVKDNCKKTCRLCN